MNGPPRLLDSSKHRDTLALLRAGREDGPPASAARRVALALGVGAGLSAATTGPAAAAPTAAAAGASVPTAAVGAGGLTTAFKLLGFGLVGGAAIAAGAWATHVPTKAPQRSAAALAPLTSVSAASAPVGTARIESKSAPDVGATTNEPKVAPAPASSPHASAGSIGAPPIRGKLRHEVALIDAARRALAARDSAEALRLLEAYATADRTFTLDREADLLRIDALAQGGRKARARTLAKQYIRRHPNDPHLTKLHALVATDAVE